MGMPTGFTPGTWRRCGERKRQSIWRRGGNAWILFRCWEILDQDRFRSSRGSGAWRHSNYAAHYNLAIVYAGLGNSDQTFAWLDRAYTQRSYYLPVYLTTDARLDRFHGDPRFLDLRRRIGLPK